MADDTHVHALQRDVIDDADAGLVQPGARWTPGQAGHVTRALMADAGLTVEDVWVRYFSITGTADELELSAHLEGLIALSKEQADILAYAMAELIGRRGRISPRAVNDGTAA